MKPKPRIAIIGGSKEANDLALALYDHNQDFGLFVTQTYSAPKSVPAVIYNADTDWNKTLTSFDAVVIAPHPFSRIDITPAIPAIALCRPAWKPGAGDNWILAKDESEAADSLKRIGAKHPLLAVGRERLAPFNALDTPDLVVRYRHNPAPTIKSGSRTVFQPGPFTVSQETDFLVREKIDCIVAHNAGGQGGWPKLEAARQLGLKVILIERPVYRWEHHAEDVTSALNWLRQHVGLDLSPLSD